MDQIIEQLHSMPFGLGYTFADELKSPYLWMKVAVTIVLAVAGIYTSTLSMKAFSDYLRIRNTGTLSPMACNLLAIIFWLVLGIWSPWLPIAVAMLFCGTFIAYKLSAEKSSGATILKCAAFAAITLGTNGAASAIWAPVLT